MPIINRCNFMLSRRWKFVSAAGALALLLSACSGSSSLNDEGIVAQDDDTQNDDTQIGSAGRLALYDSDDSAVAVLDLDSETTLQRFALAGGEPRLYTSPDKRYAVVIQRDDNQVSFIDSGLHTDDHGSHLHEQADAPELLDFTLSGSRPTHYSAHGEYGVIFFDAEEGVPSTVTVLSESDVSSALVAGELTLTNSMHGAAKFVDEHLFVTYRDPSITDTVLPASIERYAFVDGVFSFEQRYDEACPLLHGNAANEELIAFGCGDGVLIIDLMQEGYPATKLANPESIAEDSRIGTVIAHAALDEVIGVAGDQVFVIDPDAEPAFLELPFPDGVSIVAQGFNVDGETYYIVGDNGMLYLYDVMADWRPLIPVAVADRVGEEDIAPIVVSSGADDRLFVLNTNGQQLLEVDGIDGAVVRTIDLGYTATSIAWLGLSNSNDHDQYD